MSLRRLSVEETRNSDGADATGTGLVMAARDVIGEKGARVGVCRGALFAEFVKEAVVKSDVLQNRCADGHGTPCNSEEWLGGCLERQPGATCRGLTLVAWCVLAGPAG